jgi:hypothetical protein
VSPTDDQKLKAISDIVYEMWMLRKMEAALCLQPCPRWLRCAMLESFLVHYRNLREFFFTDRNQAEDAADVSHECNHKKPRRDDIIAEDFMGTQPSWATVRRQFAPPPDENARVNKALAHLSYKRPRLSLESGWDAPEMRTRIDCLWQEFLKHAAPYFRARFPEEMREIEKT